MKKVLFFAASVLALASCSSDEYIGGPDVAQKYNDGAIMFASKSKMATRSSDHVGADAAALLGKNFVVEGVKGDGSTQTEVFDHYNVNWNASTANTTESNTNDWEYVGQTNHALSGASAQTIKYWDYASSQYDFVAFSYGTSNSTDLTLTEIDYSKIGNAVASGEPVYTVTGTAEDLAKAYIADLVTLYNRDGVSEFGTTVTPKFRALGTKVRIAFYETVPGYSVKNVKFYNSASAATSAADASLFAASAIFPGAATEGTMNIYFPTVGWDNSVNGTTPDADYNQAHITFDAAVGGELSENKSFGALDYQATAEDSEAAGTYLGRSSKQATYAGTSTGNYYSMVLPLGSNDNMQIRIEYDLVPTDGAAETIHVNDARAVVPAAYTDWKANYAYTYIFKISDNTNGWTGVDGDGNVVEGLTPITFDAVVVDTEDGVQETITSVATPSITTYQEGEVVTVSNEYQAGDIYATVMDGTTAVDLSSLSAPAGVAVYVAETTNTLEGITEATVTSALQGNANGITLTSAGYSIVSAVPAADGSDLAVSAAKFTVASGKTYVFMYTDGSQNYVKVIKVQ